MSYLDGVTGVTAVQPYKSHTFALMGVPQRQSVLDRGCGAGDVLPVGGSGRAIKPAGRRGQQRHIIREARVHTLGMPLRCHVADAHKLPLMSIRLMSSAPGPPVRGGSAKSARRIDPRGLIRAAGRR